MTNNNHPITPPPELVNQWLNEFYGPQSMPGMAPGERVLHVAAVAARWGADQELDQCVEWLISNQNPRWAAALQEGRRPKPPSLQDQALDDLERIAALLMENKLPCDTGNIRRALESMPS